MTAGELLLSAAPGMEVTLGGETGDVSVPLGPDELRYWSSADRKWVQEPEAFDVWVGSDSQAALRADLAGVR